MRAPLSQLHSWGFCRADPSLCCYSQGRGWGRDWQQRQSRAATRRVEPGVTQRDGRQRNTTGSKKELDPERFGQGALRFRWKRKAKSDKSLCGACPSSWGSRSTVRNRSTTFCLFWGRDVSFLWDLPGGFTTFLSSPMARSVLSSSCPTCSLAWPVS